MSTHHADRHDADRHDADRDRRTSTRRRRGGQRRRRLQWRPALVLTGALAVAVTLALTLSGVGSGAWTWSKDTITGVSADAGASTGPTSAPPSPSASAASASQSAASGSLGDITATGGDDNTRAYVSDVPGGGLLVSYWQGSSDDAAGSSTSPGAASAPASAASSAATSSAATAAGGSPALVLSVPHDVLVSRDVPVGGSSTGSSGRTADPAVTYDGSTTTITVHLTTQAQSLYLTVRSAGTSTSTSTSTSSAAAPTDGASAAPTSAAGDAGADTEGGQPPARASSGTSAAAAVSAASTSRTVKILPLGDSIIEGQQFGGARTDLWQQFTTAGYHIDFVGSQSSGPASLPDKDNEGHSGKSIEDMLPDTAAWVKAADPDVVMVSAGGNDMMHEQGAGIAQRYVQYLDTICGAAPGVPIVVATNHQLKTTVHGTAAGGGDGFNKLMSATLNPVIRAQAGTTATGGCTVSVVDMDGVISDNLLADDLHPNAAGYAAMGQRWFPALKAAVDVALTRQG